jgi:Flp pilus assembly protein CpaB
MKQKRPLLFVVLGVLGMGFAVYVMKAASGRGTRSQGTVASVKVLRAIADVAYGQKLIHAGKEGEGQKPNVQFVDWPASFVPKGVVTDQKAFAEKEFIARADFLPGEPIFESQTVPRDQFLSVDMVVRQFTANLQTPVEKCDGGRAQNVAPRGTLPACAAGVNSLL